MNRKFTKKKSEQPIDENIKKILFHTHQIQKNVSLTTHVGKDVGKQDVIQPW